MLVRTMILPSVNKRKTKTADKDQVFRVAGKLGDILIKQDQVILLK